MYKVKFEDSNISLTEREAIIWNRLVDISYSGSNGDVSDFDDLGSRKSVGGVIASLVSKGLVMAEDTPVSCRAGDVDLWPIHPAWGAVFLCDYCDESEIEAMKVRVEAA